MLQKLQERTKQKIMRKLSCSEFMAKVQNVKPDIEILSEYKNSRCKILVRCKKCNYKWEVVTNTLMNTSCGCPCCAGNSRKDKTTFINDLKKINSNIDVCGDYVNNKTSLKCICKKDGYIWYPTPNNLLKGEGCPKCKANNTSKILSKSNENFVKDLHDINKDIKALEKYKNNKTKILVKCKVCDHEWKTTPNILLSGEGCPRCANNMRYTQEEFISLVGNRNKTLDVVDTYKNYSTRLKCVCRECGKIFYMNPSSILNGIKCPLCRDNKRREHDEFILEVNTINPYIKIMGKFTKTSDNILVKCLKCGHIWNPTASALLKGSGCRECYIQNCKGENHPNWDPNITEEERILNRNYFEYKEWVKSVYKRDDWTCQVTGKRGCDDLQAHHLDGYNWCKDKRVDINNGITITENIHREFHSIYGYGDNTTDQFIDFISEKYKNNLISIDRYNKLIDFLIHNTEVINEQKRIG